MLPILVDTSNASPSLPAIEPIQGYINIGLKDSKCHYCSTLDSSFTARKNEAGARSTATSKKYLGKHKLSGLVYSHI